MKQPIEVLPKEPTIAHREPGVTIEHLNVYMEKETMLPLPSLTPRHSFLFAILGVIAALMLGFAFAWWIWGGTPALPLIVPAASPLDTKFTVNNSTNLTSALGDTLAAHIVIRNRAPQPLEHIALTLEARGTLFDTQSVQIPFGRTQEALITIDETTLPLLRHVAAGAEVPLRFSLGIMPFVPETMKISAEPSLVTLRLTTSAVRGKHTLRPASQEVSIKVHSDTELLSQVRYFSPEGEQIGRGPLPPKVGNKTTLWIFFRGENTLNNLEHAVLTLRFAEGTSVGWTGRRSNNMGSDFLFDPFLKTASWIIGLLPANRGFTMPSPEAALEIFITPTKAMRGTTPVILKEVILSAKDMYTGALVEKKYTNINADLRFDEQGKALGVTVQ